MQGLPADPGRTRAAAPPAARMMALVAEPVGMAAAWPADARAIWKTLAAKGRPYGSGWPATPFWWLNATVDTAIDTAANTSSERVGPPISQPLVLGHFEGTSLPSLVSVKLPVRAAHRGVLIQPRLADRARPRPRARGGRAQLHAGCRNDQHTRRCGRQHAYGPSAEGCGAGLRREPAAADGGPCGERLAGVRSLRGVSRLWNRAAHPGLHCFVSWKGGLKRGGDTRTGL